jgi:tetratricopeptide (TPR) repeat protein
MTAAIKRGAQASGLLIFALAFSLPIASGAEDPKPRLPPGLIRGPSREILDIVIKGRILRNQGQREAALAVFEDALQQGRAAGDKSGQAWAMNNIASVYRYEGTDKKALDLSQKATELYERALAYSREIGDKHNEAYATLYLGVLADQRDEVERAFTFYEAALPLFQAVDDPYYVARTYVFLGKATRDKRKQPEQALALFEKALPNFRAVESWDEAVGAIREMLTAYQQLARGNNVPAKAAN